VALMVPDIVEAVLFSGCPHVDQVLLEKTATS
jgi:hypothetical protein